MVTQSPKCYSCEDKDGAASFRAMPGGLLMGPLFPRARRSYCSAVCVNASLKDGDPDYLLAEFTRKKGATPYPAELLSARAARCLGARRNGAYRGDGPHNDAALDAALANAPPGYDPHDINESRRLLVDGFRVTYARPSGNLTA